MSAATGIDTGDDMTQLYAPTVPGQPPDRDRVRQLREAYPRGERRKGP